MKNIRISNKTNLFVLLLENCLCIKSKNLIFFTNLIRIKLNFKWDIDWIYTNNFYYLFSEFNSYNKLNKFN